MERKAWTERERLAVLELYCRLPFGRLSASTPEIGALASKLGRSANSVAMKAVNFASLDPVQAARGIQGLKNASRDDRALWARFGADPDGVLKEALAVADSLGVSDMAAPADDSPRGLDLPDGPETRWQPVEVRRHQSFFRAAVLSSYGNRCALSGLAMPALLTASHIRAWSESDRAGRLDPRNGIALNALYDRAFDRGLFTLDFGLRVVVNATLPDDHSLFGISGRELQLPDRFAPAKEYLASHHDRWGYRI